MLRMLQKCYVFKYIGLLATVALWRAMNLRPPNSSTLGYAPSNNKSYFENCRFCIHVRKSYKILGRWEVPPALLYVIHRRNKAQ